MQHLALALSAVTALGPASPDPQDAAAKAAQEQESPEARARALWARLCTASGSVANESIHAFRLRADVLTRQGVQTNEAKVDYRYLAPDCMRFVLPSKNETGRFGPAPEQYWLRSGEEVVTLAGREYKEDRRQVDDMIALSKNFVALSNPAGIELTSIELMAAPPRDLGPALAKSARKLSWLAIASPDFALVRRDGASAPGASYRVEVGLVPPPDKAEGAGPCDHGHDLPALVVIREGGQATGGDPLLVELGDYRAQDGFRVPRKLLVHVLDRSVKPVAFAERASQEIYVTEAALQPKLTMDDFKPKK